MPAVTVTAPTQKPPSPVRGHQSDPQQLDDQATEAWAADELIEMSDPPPSTWFDDFDSAPAPLAPPKRAAKR